MANPDLPGVPEPIRSTVRAVPVCNPLLLAIAGVVYALVLGVLVVLWWGVAALGGVPAPPLSLRTAALLWGVGVGLALLRDTARKRRMAVEITPGWVRRTFGANTVTVPRAEIADVQVRVTVADRLARTRTFDVYDADGHRLRLPRVRDADAIERALQADVEDRGDGADGDDEGAEPAGQDRESQTPGASRNDT
ncbi:PH domain-containing protein [Halorientalis salina]|uniref:PH domain-containing protein n=1 Tax=Halorientalis salina TaxID=2932266 RepID=UPI0010AC6A28|nr:PH domain-containing protein [Halorientalis salina]